MSLVYLLRHGETQWNREEIFRGRADIPLNEAGRKQAAAAATYFAGKGIREIYSSPLKRAFETAQIVARALGVRDARKCEALTDISFGAAEGMAVAEVKSKYPETFRVWRETPELAKFPGGEYLHQVEDRAWSFIKELAADESSCPAIVVTHRVVTKLLICRALGLGPGGFWRVRQDTTAINLLRWKGDDWEVMLVNDTCHLAGVD